MKSKIFGHNLRLGLGIRLAVWLGIDDFKKRNCRNRQGLDFVAVVTNDDNAIAAGSGLIASSSVSANISPGLKRRCRVKLMSALAVQHLL
jgi:hypothetical protein